MNKNRSEKQMTSANYVRFLSRNSLPKLRLSKPELNQIGILQKVNGRLDTQSEI